MPYCLEIVWVNNFLIYARQFDIVNRKWNEPLNISVVWLKSLEVIVRCIILIDKFKDRVEDDILIGVVIHMILRWENVIFKVQSEFLIFLLKVRLLLLRAVLLADVIVLYFICLLVQVVDSLFDVESLFLESLVESEGEERWYSLNKLRVARH